jgi:histidinol dehydrogenase
MISVTKADGIAQWELIKQLKARSGETDRRVTAAVSEILEDVRADGDRAVREYTVKFDGTAPEKTEITKEQMSAALKVCRADFIESLQRAAQNIRDFHQRQKQQSWLNTLDNGSILGQRVRGLHRVGVYVPGGTAAYPSSVLMNVIPAKIAGVNEIIMVTPPLKDGTANPDILAAAAIAGVDRAFLVGGAQAVGALAYGTQTIPRVDKIVGPGNIFVATAKKLLFGTVDIDMVAGPSEILIVADETAHPEYIAADLISQAEHDVLASAVLLTDSHQLAEKTIKELERQSSYLSRRDIIEKSLDNYGAVIICKDIKQAIELANELAPEHLELCVKNPLEYIGVVDNAGSVFLGNYSPEALGDYFAGPNHVLPTGGTARFFSPLSVDSFIKKSSFIYYTENALADAKSDILNLAQAEGLTGHANSVEVRFKEGENNAV